MVDFDIKDNEDGLPVVTFTPHKDEVKANPMLQALLLVTASKLGHYVGKKWSEKSREKKKSRR